MRFALAALLLQVLLVVGSHGALVTSRSDIRAMLQPLRTERAALAPDGRRIAYTVQEEGRWQVAIVSVDNPRERVLVTMDKGRRGFLFFAGEDTYLAITFFRWVTPTRLVVAVRLANEKEAGESIFSVDAASGECRSLADPEMLSVDVQRAGIDGPLESMPRKPRIVGSLTEGPGFVFVEGIAKVPKYQGISARPSSRATTIATGLFRVNCQTGQAENIFEENIDGRMIYDRTGRPRLMLAQPPGDETQEYVRWLPGKFWSKTETLAGYLGSNFRWTLKRTTENCFGERTFPLGFDYDSDVCYFASNEGRDTYGIYAVNLATKQRLPLALEVPGYDLVLPEVETGESPLVWDHARKRLVGVRYQGEVPSTCWADEELAIVEKEVAARFTRRVVELLEWDSERRRFLVRVSSAVDPGRFYVYDRAAKKSVQFARQMPRFDPDVICPVRTFSFKTEQGVTLTGTMTQPREVLIRPPPLLVCLHDGPRQRDQAEYDREAQVFAAMGFVVVRVNYRGSAGFGRNFADALRGAPDRVPLEDIRATVAWVAKETPIDRRRVALYGFGFGGYLALRGVQLYPQEYRCALAREAPVDLESWLTAREADGNFEDMRLFMRAAEQMMQSSIRGLGGRRGGLDEGSSASGEDGGTGDGTGEGSRDGGMGAGGMGGMSGMERPRNPMMDLMLERYREIDFDGRALQAWFKLDDKRMKEASPLASPEKFGRPILLVVENYGMTESQDQAKRLRNAVKAKGLVAELLEHQRAKAEDFSVATEEVYTGIQEFFNVHLYNFDVKVGTPEVKGQP